MRFGTVVWGGRGRNFVDKRPCPSKYFFWFWKAMIVNSLCQSVKYCKNNKCKNLFTYYATDVLIKISLKFLNVDKMLKNWFYS